MPWEVFYIAVSLAALQYCFLGTSCSLLLSTCTVTVTVTVTVNEPPRQQHESPLQHPTKRVPQLYQAVRYVYTC